MTFDNDFLARMAALLGAEFADFAAALGQPGRSGLRVNTLKTDAAAVARLGFGLTPLGSAEPDAFLVDPADQPGKHPWHAAGAYYLQDPSAMMAARLVAPRPGERVLDLCAAPGGKTTHLATLMGDSGFLLANDIHARRARDLLENVERWGCRSVCVTNETPTRLADALGAQFDRVLVDAPCSGEGMFRKRGPFAWDSAQIAACARRQGHILVDAARLVRPGGRLVYATCTFAPEENEGSVARFLAAHADFALVEPPRLAGFAPGRPDWLDDHPSPDGPPPPDGASPDGRADLRRAVRLWPHRFPGEGHFIAVMQRDGVASAESHPPPPPPRLPRAQRAAFADFARDTLVDAPPDDRLELVGDRLLLLPADRLDVARLHLLRLGVLLGELRGERRGVYFRPNHALALTLTPAAVRHSVDLDPHQTAAYLFGHDLDAAGADGWALVTSSGLALGWGKRVRGRLKNHYPHHLRRPYAT